MSQTQPYTAAARTPALVALSPEEIQNVSGGFSILKALGIARTVGCFVGRRIKVVRNNRVFKFICR